MDQVLLLGFDGVDASAPIVAELRERQLGGVLVGPQNGAVARAGRRHRPRGARRRPHPAADRRRAGGRDLPRVPGAPARPSARSTSATPRIPSGPRHGERKPRVRWRALGFDLNLFPVADVATIDSPVGGRAFSDDSIVAAELTAAALRGCAETERRLRAASLPGTRRRLAGHGRGSGDGQPRRGVARGARPRAVPRRGRRGRSGDRALRRPLLGLRRGHPGAR